MPGGLQALNQSRLDGCKVWVCVWLEAPSFLQTEPWLDASNPEQLDLSRPCGCKFGLCLARSFLFLRDRVVFLNRGGLFEAGVSLVPGSAGRLWEVIELGALELMGGPGA